MILCRDYINTLVYNIYIYDVNASDICINVIDIISCLGLFCISDGIYLYLVMYIMTNTCFQMYLVHESIR